MLRKQTQHNAVFRTLEGMFQAVERLYERVLRFCVRHRLLIVVAGHRGLRRQPEPGAVHQVRVHAQGGPL